MEQNRREQKIEENKTEEKRKKKKKRLLRIYEFCAIFRAAFVYGMSFNGIANNSLFKYYISSTDTQTHTHTRTLTGKHTVEHIISGGGDGNEMKTMQKFRSKVA